MSMHVDFCPLLLPFCSFQDPGPHGNGRYSLEMLPEIEERDFRKGAQVHIFVKSFPYYCCSCNVYQFARLYSPVPNSCFDQQFT